MQSQQDESEAPPSVIIYATSSIKAGRVPDRSLEHSPERPGSSRSGPESLLQKDQGWRGAGISEIERPSFFHRQVYNPDCPSVIGLMALIQKIC